MKQYLSRKYFIILVSLFYLFPLSLIASDDVYSMGVDVDNDGVIGISDVTALIDFLLTGDGELGDVNNDGLVTIDDAVYLIDQLLTPAPSIPYTLILNRDSVKVEIGKRFLLMATIEPNDVRDLSISWHSTDNSIAKVSKSGNYASVEAVSVGECDIVGEWMGLQASCHVEVIPVELKSITLENDYLMMRVDESRTMHVTLTPSNVDTQDLVWLSSDSNVAKIHEGVVTAVGPGVCEVMVQCQGKQATCKIAVLKTVIVNGVSFDMMPVEGGTFMMGAASGEFEAMSYESPQHKVTLSDYFIGLTEVTQEMWHSVMNYTPGHFKRNPKHPVENVSWEDCQEFIKKLNEMTGLRFHLPTEAQWEFAARGGNQSLGFKFAGGENINELGWYYINSGKLGEDDPNYGTHDVALMKPNELNLYDMTGNVREWCNDYYSPYSAADQVDPQGPAIGSMVVYRGGSWNDYASCCRVAFRYPEYLATKNDKTGLRLAL